MRTMSSNGDGRGARRPDRTSPVPLWAQVLADLERRLQAGELQDRFPTDRELVGAYGVSRQTAREAVRRLQAQGVLERERGRGTRVVQPELEQPVGSLYSLFRAIEAQGLPQESVVRVLEEREGPDAAARLGLAATEPLVHLERLRLAAGTPLALDRAWLPAAVAGPLIGASFERTGLYDELATRCGLHPAHGWERIRPVLPVAAERRLLGTAKTTAAFFIERLTSAMVAGEERPVEWRESLVRGDRYAFVAEWRGAWSGGPAAGEALVLPPPTWGDL